MRSSLTFLFILVLGISTSYGQNGAKISGRVVYEGPQVEMKYLTVTTDDPVCSGTEIPDETLIVDPQYGGLKNAVVYLDGLQAQEGWQPESEPIIDQVGCTFTPHVVILPLGQSLKIRNSDGILHNFHTSSEHNRPVNLAMPKTQTELEIPGRRFRRPDFINTKCDVHGWMSGVIVVAEHPFYVLTDDQGEFELNDVPPGAYNLVVWHESLAGNAQTITVNIEGANDLKIVLRPANTD